MTGGGQPHPPRCAQQTLSRSGGEEGPDVVGGAFSSQPLGPHRGRGGGPARQGGWGGAPQGRTLKHGPGSAESSTGRLQAAAPTAAIGFERILTGSEARKTCAGVHQGDGKSSTLGLGAITSKKKGNPRREFAAPPPTRTAYFQADPAGCEGFLLHSPKLEGGGLHSGKSGPSHSDKPSKKDAAAHPRRRAAGAWDHDRITKGGYRGRGYRPRIKGALPRRLDKLREFPPLAPVGPR